VKLDWRKVVYIVSGKKLGRDKEARDCGKD
jgi:hypothetical protein